MIVMQAAAAEPAVQQRLFNLVDLIITKFSLNTPERTPLFILTYLVGVLLCIAVPYLLGSINPAILISKSVYHEDIRQFGSGNAGTTNMLRTYGKKAALATFLLDLSKAAVSCFFGLLVWEMNGLGIAGFFVMFGHMYPIFEKFKGGKGVACLCVVVLITSIFTNSIFGLRYVPVAFLLLLLCFIVIVLGTRYVSLGSVFCAFLYPVLLKTCSNENAGICVAMAVLSACFVIYKHKENMIRIRNRKESQISFKKTDKKKRSDDGETDNGEADE